MPLISFRLRIETVGANNVFSWQDTSNKLVSDLFRICLRKTMVQVSEDELSHCIC